MSEPIALGDLAAVHFEPLVGEQFEVPLPEDRTEQLLLVSVEPYHDHIGGSERTRIPFSLTFRGVTPGMLLLQRMHLLVHPALGPLELFLVPIEHNSDGTYNYEAAFA